MSRSKHTDPKAIRAARRLRAPRRGRGAGDLSRRRELGRELKRIGADSGEQDRKQNSHAPFRVLVQKPRREFHHPADKRDVMKMLQAVGPIGLYGVRSIELARSPANGPSSSPVFGRYRVPARILLFEQPMPPWRLTGLLQNSMTRRLERAGAVLTVLSDVGATLVDWPADTLRQFMLDDVLLHELGHHVLQHHKGKRLARTARTRDHEAFAARFAERQRATLRKGNRH